MNAETHGLIEKLHNSPTSAVVAVAGAGAQAITWLLLVPRASRTVLEVIVPYASSSFVEFLGHEPGQFVSVQAAEHMAHAAYARAVHLRNDNIPIAGIACTATIATDRPKRGAHRCHVAAWDEHGITTYSLELVKGLRNRVEEDDIVSKIVLRALADSCYVHFDLDLDLTPDEEVELHRLSYDDPIQALLADHVGSSTIHCDGTIVADEKLRGGILPGSFNPLHQGHQKLAAVASDLLSSEVTFEMSISNVDKPAMEESEIRSRAAQFAGFGSVVVTRALVFYQKARLFPGCTFVIGWDTATRLVDPHYYDGDEARMLMALDQVRKLDCRFLVAGRIDDGVFRTLNDVEIPGAFADMFTQIPESAFRHDLSSSELRKADQKV